MPVRGRLLLAGEGLKQHGVAHLHLQPPEEIRGSLWGKTRGGEDAPTAREPQIHVSLPGPAPLKHDAVSCASFFW